MKSTALLSLALFCSCQGQVGVVPVEPGPVERNEGALEAEERANLETWHTQGERLATEAQGEWVLIVAGEIHGPWPSFEDALPVARELCEGARHAFLYRPGVDDRDREFALSPFSSSDPHWNQVGIRWRQQWQIGIAASMNLWNREGHSVAWGDQEARLRLESIDGKSHHNVRVVASGLFEDELCLAQADARTLGAGVFRVPGRARYAGSTEPCEKLLLRASIPQLEIDGPLVAYVLPASVTAGER